ncbi:MAG: DUF2341 domain-containing protein [Gammaproteobacteria bacterium]
MFLRVVLVALLSTLLASGDAHAWWHDDWPYRKAITIDPANLPAGSAAIDDATVLLRLHPGNFDYFFNLREDAGDLRFISADDLTAYPYHVEHYDAAAGIALVWLRLPRVAADMAPLWMYYGNPEAPPADLPAESVRPDRALTLHFGESGGSPRDSSSFGLTPEVFTARLVPNGLIGRGARFAQDSTLVLPTSPVLDPGATGGTTLSFWLYLDRPAATDHRLRIVGHAATDGALTLEIDDGIPVLSVRDAGATQELRSERALAWEHWHHLALTLDTEVGLYLDGERVASGAAPQVATNGMLIAGATQDTGGFSGLLDELAFDRRVLPAHEIALAAATQGPERALLALGADESHGGGEAIAEYFSLFASMFTSVRPEGWVILLLLALLGLAAVDVLLTKAVALARIERADAHFLDAFATTRLDDDTAADGLGADGNQQTRHSSLLRVYRAGLGEWKLAVGDASTHHGGAAAVGLLDAVRAGLEAALVAETERLNARLVVLTLAVSGGPFLGLLGTVLGVMITFASIAAQGEVNVNTIAPGVAAALTTTVMGLVVAIPAMFGYNYLAGRITRRITGMEVFAEQLLSRLARRLARAAP